MRVIHPIEIEIARRVLFCRARRHQARPMGGQGPGRGGRGGKERNETEGHKQTHFNQLHDLNTVDALHSSFWALDAWKNPAFCARVSRVVFHSQNGG